jgi:hypothetical protein
VKTKMLLAAVSALAIALGSMPVSAADSPGNGTTIHKAKKKSKRAAAKAKRRTESAAHRAKSSTRDRM